MRCMEPGTFLAKFGFWLLSRAPQWVRVKWRTAPGITWESYPYRFRPKGSSGPVPAIAAEIRTNTTRQPWRLQLVYDGKVSLIEATLYRRRRQENFPITDAGVKGRTVSITVRTVAFEPVDELGVFVEPADERASAIVNILGG